VPVGEKGGVEVDDVSSDGRTPDASTSRVLISLKASGSSVGRHKS
jgi:hypothetical protein